MRRIKLVAIVIVSILTIVILAENTEPVPARLIVPKVQISLALLMMLVFFLGFVIGILVPTYFLRKTDGKAKSGPGQNR